MTNERDRWSAASADGKRVLFTIWADRIDQDHYEFSEVDEQVRGAGARQMREHMALVQKGAKAYGILCLDKNQRAKGKPRSRKLLMIDGVLLLRFEWSGTYPSAKLIGESSIDEVLRGKSSAPHPTESAVDDIDTDNDYPQRKQVVTSAFSRNPEVRRVVLERAEGKCEFANCTSNRSFETIDGRRYLETHHVIGLANDGPDVPENVIALCANHHREAHYGKKGAQLEKAFHKYLDELYARKQK